MSSTDLQLDAGELGDLPAGLTVSVRTEYASQMSAINLTIKGAPDEWALTVPVEVARMSALSHFTPECRRLSGRLLEIVARHYERDNEVRFVSVSLDNGMGLAG
jgi:hypothetical protein